MLRWLKIAEIAEIAEIDGIADVDYRKLLNTAEIADNSDNSEIAGIAAIAEIAAINEIVKIDEMADFAKVTTGGHQCSSNSPNLQAPDTQLTNTNVRVLCQTCVTSWVDTGGFGITCFSNAHVRVTRQATFKRSRHYVFKNNIVLFRQIKRPKGLSVKTKMKAGTKLTVVMCCQIVDRKSTASSNDRFQQRPAPPLAC